jgi:hypothetical protein
MTYFNIHICPRFVELMTNDVLFKGFLLLWVGENTVEGNFMLQPSPPPPLKGPTLRGTDYLHSDQFQPFQTYFLYEAKILYSF